MDPAWDRPRGPRPSTASIRVRELSWQGLRNPCPKSKGPGSRRDGCRGQLVEQRLSPARLQALAGVDDLQLVRVLEMSVDTREGSLGNFGVHLPNLDQLKLNGSRLGSLRDLGTSLGRLQVLWLARCGLNDLDGIGSFPALKELYVSYNNISDLSPLCLLEQLEVLDLEGNSVEDLEQVRYLQLCPRLATLTLEGNLVCLRPAPDPSNKVCVPRTQPAHGLGARGLGVRALVYCLQGAPLQRFNPELSLPETQPRAPRSWSFSLLVPGGPLPQDLLPEDPAQADNASNLTHGAGQVLCGNPTKGLRERRHQCQAWVPPEQLPARRPGDLATSTSTLGPDPADSCDLLDLGRHRARREPGLGWVPLWPEDLVLGSGPCSPFCLWPFRTCRPFLCFLEPSRTLSFHLTPSPPKCPMPPDSGSSSPWRSADLFRGRQLRGPGLGRGVAAVTALRALEVASGLSAGAQGCPGPKPAPDPAARPPGLQCRRHLNPMAQSHP
uniref:Leucine rich repeat containing 56 n=1 Tax=Microcebus murinus TaxID=30608 RepID=A0A8C5XL97_MICMU